MPFLSVRVASHSVSSTRNIVLSLNCPSASRAYFLSLAGVASLFRSESGAPARTMDPLFKASYGSQPKCATTAHPRGSGRRRRCSRPDSRRTIGQQRRQPGSVVEVNRDRVVQRAAQTCWRHRPTIDPAIGIEPRLYLIEAISEAPRRYANPDPYWKTALGVANGPPCRDHHAASRISHRLGR